MWPDAPALRAFLSRAVARLRVIAALEGAAVGLVLAVLLAVFGVMWSMTSQAVLATAIAVLFAIAGAVARVAFMRSQRVAIAAKVERRAPECRNVLITAAELLDGRAGVREYVASLVCRDAARAVAPLNVGAMFPLRRAALSLAGAIALWAIAARATVAGPVVTAARDAREAVIDAVDITVTPPAYASQSERHVRNPSSITALAGSRVRIALRASAATVTLETLVGRTDMAPSAPNSFAADISADADGYIALEPRTQSGMSGARRLIGLSVTPDQPPRVRISAPARDLFVPDAHRVINVAIEASDDIGLASLRLRYTKVSGSGEQFTFTDGEVPVEIVRTNGNTWKATGVLRLDSLKLGAGDMVVYRGVATDMRPGAPPAESDSYIVEITAPGAVAAEGFAVDDERDRYGISQQMVILKTERLIAGRRGMAVDSLAGDAQGIAAEQRAVRAEFVFMLGGEVAEEILAAENLTDLNEESEAQGEADIAAGRLANRGRLDMVRAIRSMSQASALLVARDLDKALVQERSALKYLQAAFARTRYILRALSLRERLDASRRMTGDLTGAARDARPVVASQVDARVRALRRELAQLGAIAGASELDAHAAADAAAVAQRLLRLDPASGELQQVARRLTDAESAMRRGDRAASRAQLDSAAVSLAGVIRGSLPDATRADRAFDAARLDGALTDALRRGTPR